MTIRIIRERPTTRQEWLDAAHKFLEMRRGLWEATDQESLVGYIDGFRPVYVTDQKIDGETWYVWFVWPGEGKSDRVVNELSPGVLVDAQNGDVYDHDPEWTLFIGTVTRIGNQPLLTREMLGGAL